MNDRFKLLISTGFGLGLFPYAPGTFGTLLGVVLVWDSKTHVNVIDQHAVLLLYFACIIFIHFQMSPWAIKFFKSSDPKQFIIDEIAGYLLTVLIIGNSLNKYGAPLWKQLIISFVLFRFCDIIKMPGAKYIDKHLHDKVGLGILLDDLISAMYAGGSLRLLSMFIK